MNVGIVLLEVLFGVLSGSLSLIADALHNLQDVAVLGISMVAKSVMGRGATPTKTYGYRRAEALAAFINSLLLMGALAYLSYEAVISLVRPREVVATTVILMGWLAFLVNFLSAHLLHREEDLNLRSAHLHLLGDATFSLAVAVGGILMWSTGWRWVDALLVLAFVPYLLWEGFKVLRDATGILMEFAPRGYTSDLVRGVLLSAEGVRDAHDIHVWSLSSDEILVSAHLIVEGDARDTLRRVEGMLREMGIHHITLQLEGEGYTCSARCD